MKRTEGQGPATVGNLLTNRLKGVNFFCPLAAGIGENMSLDTTNLLWPETDDWAEEMVKEWIAAYRMDYDIYAFKFFLEVTEAWPDSMMLKSD